MKEVCGVFLNTYNDCNSKRDFDEKQLHRRKTDGRVIAHAHK